MHWESETRLRELIEARDQLLESAMMNAPVGASEPAEETLNALMELDGLISELEFSRDKHPGADEPDATLGVPVTPRPRLNSGAVALPELDFE